MEPRSKTDGVIRLDYSTGMEMGICREADLIIINHPIDESAGWAVVSVTEYIGVPPKTFAVHPTTCDTAVALQ